MNIISGLKDRKWLIALISSGIAVAAAAISIIVYMSRKDEEALEEDIFAE